MTTLAEFSALSSTQGINSIEPLWAKNAHKDKAKFKEWFTKHLPIVEEFNKYRIWTEWNNLLWYTGDILDYVIGYRQLSDYSGFQAKAKRTIPFWVDQVGNLTDKRANDLSSLKPNFEILPPDFNISEKTRLKSRVAKPVVSHIRTFNNLDMLFDSNERLNCTYGKSFLLIDWNDKIGDRKFDEETKDKRKAIGWEGEVEVKETFPWYILSWPGRIAFQKPCAIQILEIIHKEEAKKKYALKEVPEIKQSTLFNFASPFEASVAADEVVIYRVIYTPDEYLENGAVIYCLNDGTVLREPIVNKYPWSHNEFPWEMHDDINLKGKIFPYSILQYLKPMQWTYNLLGAMIRKNIFLCAHPKWMAVRGAASFQSFGNTSTVVWHKPGQKPSLERYDVVGNDTYRFREDLRGEMQKRSGSFGLSSGEVPPNTRSGIQISRLQNIEKMQKSHQIEKRNDFMRRTLLKSLSVASDRYPTTSEEHLIRILGPVLAPDIGVLAQEKVIGQTSITIQNSSGFSDDLAGRLEEVAFAQKNIPGLLTTQQQADIVGIRSAQKFYDITTAALRMAESENEAFNDGSREVSDPLLAQDHIVHWTTHVIDMQTPQHRNLPEKIRKLKERHIGIHEMMMEKLAASPYGIAFKQKLAMLERYPLFYRPNNDISAIQAEQEAEKQQQMVAQQGGMGAAPAEQTNGVVQDEQPLM